MRIWLAQRQVVIHGKGGRIDRLPLPADVGALLVDYLRRGQRASTHPCGRHPDRLVRAELGRRALLPTLSTYLEHASSATTYLYLQACPPLMTATVKRLESFWSHAP